MKKLVSYFFVFNLILFGLIACETSDNSTGFYTGDSLATKETNEAKEIGVFFELNSHHSVFDNLQMMNL